MFFLAEHQLAQVVFDKGRYPLIRVPLAPHEVFDNAALVGTHCPVPGNLLCFSLLDLFRLRLRHIERSKAPGIIHRDSACYFNGGLVDRFL